MHSGRPSIRNSPDGKRVTVLCPIGHLYTSMSMRDWAGSWLEAKATDPNWVVECHGALPQCETPDEYTDRIQMEYAHFEAKHPELI